MPLETDSNIQRVNLIKEKLKFASQYFLDNDWRDDDDIVVIGILIVIINNLAKGDNYTRFAIQELILGGIDNEEETIVQ